MAGRTQPIVYKPTNVTKYADAYANRLNAAAAEAKKQQAIRDKRRQKMSDELDVSMAGTFVAPAAQDAWDAYREEKMKYLQENPNKIKRVISELTEYKKSLGGVDEEYIRKSSAIDPNTQHGVDYAMSEAAKGLPEGANYNNINQVRQAALDPFNFVVEKMDLEKAVQDNVNQNLKDLYNSNRREEFFGKNEPIVQVDPITGRKRVDFGRSVLEEKRGEVADMVGSNLGDDALVEASWRAQLQPDFSMDSYIKERVMGLSPLVSQAGPNYPGSKDKSYKLEKGEYGWSNSLFSFLKSEISGTDSPIGEEGFGTNFVSIEKQKSYSGDVPSQTYKLDKLNDKGEDSVTGVTIGYKKDDSDGKLYAIVRVKDAWDNSFETVEVPLVGRAFSTFRNVFKISEKGMNQILEDNGGMSTSDMDGGTQSGNVGYNNPNNKRFTQSPPPTPPSMGQ